MSGHIRLQKHLPSENVPLREARCQSLFSGTATPVLLLLLLDEAPARRVREWLVYHCTYCTHLCRRDKGRQYNEAQVCQLLSPFPFGLTLSCWTAVFELE